MNGLRRVVCFAVCAGALTVHPAMAAESVLVNPGFEMKKDVSPAFFKDLWHEFGKNARRVQVSARSGTYSGKASGDFSNSANFCGFMQSFDANAGEEWMGAVWIRQSSEDPMGPGSEAFAKIEFYDANGKFLEAQESANRVTSRSAIWVYMRSGVSVIAPVRTATVRFVAMFAQYDGKSKGTVFFDDAELIKVDK
ncbi:MAG: hypothetical protein V1929_00930 [bacterium]